MVADLRAQVLDASVQLIDGVLGEKYLEPADREKHVAMVLELFATAVV